MVTTPYDANQSDFLGEGTAAPVLAPQQNLTPLQQQEQDLARSRFNATVAGTPYGTPNFAGGSATPFMVSQTPNGRAAMGTNTVVARQYTQGANGTPAITGAGYVGTYNADGSPVISNAFSTDAQHQTQAAGTPGYDISQTSPNAAGLAPADAYGHAAPGSVWGAGGSGGGGAGGGQFGLADQVNSARQTGAGFLGYGNQALQNTQGQANSLLAQGQAFNPQAQQVAGQFGVGQRSAAPSAVDPSGLGALNTNVAAGLGAAPTVNKANVGMVKTTAAPGAVTPQLGSQGASGADQQSMFSRVNGFLDAPQGPSVAEAQLRQTQAENAAQLMGAARSGRGTSGDQAEALREAMAGGSALMSDTAGQLATLRAQEQDMRQNRNLSAMGLGNQIATDTRGQDLGYRGQNLASLQGDQATALGARGQNLQASQGNQSAQLGLEQLRGQLGLGARGQNLSALQGDQGAQLGARGQNLSALQGNQSTALGARGQDLTARAQDLGALQGDQNANLAAQQLGLQGQLGLSGLGLQAQGQGLQASAQQNALGLGAEQMAQQAIGDSNRNALQQSIANGANQTQLAAIQQQIASRPSLGQQLGMNILGGLTSAVGGGLVSSIFSPNTMAPNYSPGPYGGAGGVY